MYTIISILIVTIVFCELSVYSFGYFAKNKTIFLKALLPFMIITHHTHLFDGDFYYVGAFVVSLFFFISGYGLESKRKVNTISNKWFVRSLKKLTIPLIVPIVIYMGIRLCKTPLNTIIAEDILKYQLVLPHTWFVLTLILIYVIYHICVTLQQKLKKPSFLIVITVAILTFNFFGKYLGVPSWGRNTTTAFLAGIFYKEYEGYLVNWLNKKIMLWTISLSMAIVLVTMFIQGDLFTINSIVTRPVSAFCWSLLFMVSFSIVPERVGGG